jgi:hypothetical protein
MGIFSLTAGRAFERALGAVFVVGSATLAFAIVMPRRETKKVLVSVANALQLNQDGSAG